MADYTHLVVGAGRMGGALLSGWLSAGAISAKQLVILDPTPADAAQAAISVGALHISGVAECPSGIQTVLLSIKPQMFEALGSELAACLSPEALIVSILAGTSLDRLETAFTGHPVIRAMPNTPSAIGAGITAFTV